MVHVFMLNQGFNVLVNADSDFDGGVTWMELLTWAGACNFSPNAAEDDGSCLWPEVGEDRWRLSLVFSVVRNL